MVALDHHRLNGEPPKAEYFVPTRHVGHVWWNRALAAVGRDRVVRLASGGIETVVKTVMDLARKPLGGGIAFRAHG